MDKKDLTLVEHLNELRTRVIVCLAAWLIGGICSFPYAGYILKIFKLPAAGLITKLAFFTPQEAFMA